MKKVDAETEQMIKDYVFARDAEAKWKKRKDAMRTSLDDVLGAVEEGDMIVDPMEANVLLVVKVIPSYRLNQKKLKAQFPEAYAQCQELSTQVRLETPK